jgi:CysZ protein
VLIIRGLTLFVYLKFYRYLVLIVLAPVYVNTAKIIHDRGESPHEHFNFWHYCFCSWRGIRLALRNFLYELLFSFLLVLASVIIIWISPLIPFLMLLIESYYFGMVMMDYNYEMKGYGRKDSSELIKRNFTYTVGNGLVFNLLLLIPILGVVFAPVFALVAAYSGMDSLKK